MTPDEVRETRQGLHAEIEEIRIKLALKQHELKALQIRCKHPTRKQTGDYSGATYSYGTYPVNSLFSEFRPISMFYA